MCPYDGCDGSTVLDGIDWAEIRRYNPEYPEIPIKGVVYPDVVLTRTRMISPTAISKILLIEGSHCLLVTANYTGYSRESRLDC